MPSAGAAATVTRARDVTATTRFITAVTRYYRTALADRSRQTAGADALVAQVTAGCPGQLPSSLAHGTAQQQAVYVQLLTEAGVDLGLSYTHTLRGALAAQDRVFAKLRWSTSRVNGELSRERAVIHASRTITPTSLCTDVKAAAASGDTTVPAATTRLVSAAARVQAAPTLNTFLTALKPYIAPREKAAVTRARALQKELQSFETKLGTSAGNQLVAALGGSAT